MNAKDQKGWRYTFTGLEKQMKNIDPQPLIMERRRAPTKEEFEKAQLKLMTSQENLEHELDEKRKSVIKPRHIGVKALVD